MIEQDTGRTRAIRQSVKHLDPRWIRWLDEMLGKLRNAGASDDINLHAILQESRFPTTTKLTPVFRRPKLDC